jgi:hypothetical protein
MPDIEPRTLDFKMGLPGEGAFVALMTYLTKRRETMSQSNRDEADRIETAMLRGWHNWWVSLGWPGEKV